MLTKEQRDFLITYAYNAAIRAGAEVLYIYNHIDDPEITTAEDAKPITIADKRSHNVIKENLDPTRIPILSEEGRHLLYSERKGWDLFWLVDPLDGTREFLKGNGEFTINIALVYNNEPVLGVIYVPYTNLLYFCDKQVGSFKKSGVIPESNAAYNIAEVYSDVTKLPVADGVPELIKIAISRSHNTDQTYSEVDKIRAKHPNSIVIEQGSSYKFCMLAEGSVDYYVRTSDTLEWDTAAGELILACAGGETVAIDSDSSKLSYNKEELLNPHFICRSRSVIK